MATDTLGLEDFVREVLENRFPGETFKHKIKKTAQGMRFHCPYCGDTYSTTANPRGNLYIKSGRYKCFNGGCFASTSLNSFVSKWADEYNIDTSGIDFNTINLAETEISSYNNMVITKDNTICDYLSDMKLYDKMPSIEYVIGIFGLKDILSIDSNSNVANYLRGRCAYMIPDVNKRIYADYADDKIYIMNVDDRKGKVLSYATRSIFEKKYMIHVYSDFFNVWKPKEKISEDDSKFLDMISSYYNILNVDFSKPVNISEGQFDSMFLDNYMAIQGVSKSGFILNHIDSDNINLFFDYDEAGVTTTNNMLDKGSYGFFLWSETIDKLNNTFSDSSKDIKKIHDINELYKFLYSKFGIEFSVSKFNEFLKNYIRRFEKNKLAFNLFDSAL